jgi:hypothetical protein
MRHMRGGRVNVKTSQTRCVLNSEARGRECVPPWVVGTRGVFDADGISKAMVVMEVPEQRRKDLLWITAVASVEALVFMHRVGNLVT